MIDAATLLLRARDAHGRGPLPWVAAPLQTVGRVLDLCCGDGALGAELPPGCWLGIDPRPGPRRPRLRGRPTAIPLRPNTVDGVALLLTLPHLRALDSVFAEVRRVLRPGGTLVLLVPSRLVRTLNELRYARVLGPVRRGGWTNRSALDQTGWLLNAADFAVLGDDRVPFGLPLPDAAAALSLTLELAVSGLWPTALPADVLRTVGAGLADRAGPGATLPVPLRRLVARR